MMLIHEGEGWMIGNHAAFASNDWCTILQFRVMIIPQDHDQYLFFSNVFFLLDVHVFVLSLF